MPRFDQHCTSCDWQAEIVASPHAHPPCPTCGGTTERFYPIGGATHAVVGDDFIGGQWFENLAPTPVYIESKSHLKREMATRGLTERVRHVGVPGTDKSPFTTRWI
jgi:hypothetical protein